MRGFMCQSPAATAVCMAGESLSVIVGDSEVPKKRSTLRSDEEKGRERKVHQKPPPRPPPPPPTTRGDVIQHRFGNQESHCDGTRVTSGSAGEPIKGEKSRVLALLIGGLTLLW
ncbi:Protein SODIUM POTASSIUM ROOT DEFECTIVE 1 like [Actinidia chinensis var. chinensis]|uniref:Protein SODIUM POTASSIUM ROOT DEFECTIVE 1 like n=1 Tax=Actinidia chinensis var. chinensis TaxID=1590841 RepID=A0A2R6Q6D3_ACTCC|nr:Protein SODIUM POTASSIUM ROOT DEFECTIVE 1 like [Actinidia chinensis var. chinensis]